MKKTLPAVGLLLILAGAAWSQPILTQNWYKPPATTGATSSFIGTAHTERGLAYNPLTDHVLVVSRKTGLQVVALNAANGDSVGKLDVTGISGGTFALNLIGVADDGVVYGCNLVISSASPFKIYRWANEAAVPTVAFNAVVDALGTTTDRYGDAFAVTGSGTGTKIYASGGGTPANEWVAVFSTTDGVNFAWTDTVKVGSGNARLGVDAVAATGNIWGNGFNLRPGLFTPTGDTVGTLSKTVVGDSSYGMKYFEVAGQSFVAVANRTADGTPKTARVVNVSGGPGTAFIQGVTPTLATNGNANGTAAFAFDSNRGALIALITNNGIGSYGTPQELPIELAAFSASVIDGRVRLEWTTGSESNNLGFDIERSTDKVNFTKIGFVHGAGTTATPRRYSFIDSNARPGTYYYRLKQVDFDGTFTYSSLRRVVIEVPKAYALEQNYPNPFNPTTTVRYQLPEAGEVSLIVYNTLGQALITVVKGHQAAGVHTATIEASSLPSGIYFYKLSANGFSAVRKMIIMK